MPVDLTMRGVEAINAARSDGWAPYGDGYWIHDGYGAVVRLGPRRWYIPSKAGTYRSMAEAMDDAREMCLNRLTAAR